MGAGALVGIFGNAFSQEMSANAKNDTAAQQKAKAQQLEQQANQIVAKNPINDPAYKMKAFLAAAGLPGYEQYLQGFGQSEANALGTAEKVAPSGGSLLETLGALEAQKNAKTLQLNAENARYIEGKKIDLANTRYDEQEHFDEIARNEKAKLNYAATQYENAALEQHQAATEQQAGLVGSTFSNLGSLAGGLGGGGTVPSFGSNNGQSSTGDMSMQALFNLNNPQTTQ